MEINDLEDHRITVDELTLDQLTDHIKQIRERRFAITVSLKRAKKLQDAAYNQQQQNKYHKQMQMAMKELKRLDALLDKLDNRVSKLQTLSLELTGNLDVFKEEDITRSENTESEDSQ